MKKYTKWTLVVLGVSVFTGTGAFASSEQKVIVAPVAAEHLTTETILVQSKQDDVMFVDLPDQLNLVENTLSSAEDIHYFRFKAVRGQKVVVSTPDRSFGKVPWVVEYYQSDQWLVKNTNQPLVFSELKPGEAIEIRILHDKNQKFIESIYTFSIGSYPILAQSKLDGPADLALVPLTNVRTMGTQTNGPLTLKAQFKDSTGSPLKGAIAKLHLYKTLDSSRVDVVKEVRSNETGWASLSFDIGRCMVGDFSARAIREMPHGYIYTWVTNYNVGGWYVFDPIVGDSGVNDNFIFGLGHFCSQNLVEAVRIRG